MTQEQALSILKSGANVFLTGEPGAGKTHTINQYVAYLREHMIEPALTASTGIAATHISGMTIHSWSGIGIKPALTRYELDAIANNERIYKRMLKAKVLIIDEISMLESRTLNMVETVCRTVRRNHLPFGGMQIIFVGDFFQLPPVVRDGRPTEFSFESEAWAKALPITCYLSEQYRQDDAQFLSVLSAIRANAVEQDHIQTLTSRVGAHDASSDVVKLFSHNIDVDRINEKELARLDGGVRKFAMESRGTPYLIDSLRRSCLSPDELLLKPNAAVMFTRNNPQAGFVNGTLGTITNFDGGGTPVVRTRTGIMITAEPMEWKIEDQGQVLASVKQVPLRLAWAMTIHKSQGMSLDAAVMDLGSAFEYGQGYVALSRVRRLSGLFLLGCNQRALEVHPHILEQDRRFREGSREAEKQFGQMSKEEGSEMEKNFIVACGGKIIKQEKSARGGSASGGEVSAIATLQKTSPKAYTRWSEEEEKELITFFHEGLAVKEIAGRMQRKHGGITSRLKRLGLWD